ncbi:hypothetical protein AB0877_01055 [Micromonospora sp. NPDC047644]|uniref:hypothetical protein n=1 Tax=Micromonospora sp. NPDC047644 TaxID=3157203 RepID=UPI003455C90E
MVPEQVAQTPLADGGPVTQHDDGVRLQVEAQEPAKRCRDLRDGKATVMMTLARQSASASQTRITEQLPGSPDLDDAGAERLREIIMDTGGLLRVEEMIDRRTEQAVAPCGK